MAGRTGNDHDAGESGGRRRRVKVGRAWDQRM